MAIDFTLSDEQRAIEDAVGRICTRFDDGYWLDCDQRGAFPHEFRAAMAEGGWLGITMPPEHGGAGLGIRVVRSRRMSQLCEVRH